MTSKLNIRQATVSMCQVAVCTALLCVLSPLSIPTPIGVGFTTQVLIVLITALILKPAQALAAQLIYTLLGILGLPVFSMYKSGFGVLTSPTGGFIIGFIYIPGVAVFMITTGSDFMSAFLTVAGTFLLIDLAKCVIASLFALPINKSLKKLR